MNLASGVFFDLDGTLLDTAPDFETAINRVLASEGMQPLDKDTARLRRWVSDGSAGIVKAAFEIDEHHSEFMRLRQALLDEYTLCLTEKTQIFPGLEKSLELLEKHHIPWGIVTNKPVLYATPIVQKIVPQCAVLICPDHVKITKPDPEGLLQACKTLEISADNCIYAGDHIRDIKAGNAAGMKTVAVKWGYIHPDEDTATWNADFVISEPLELHKILQESLF